MTGAGPKENPVVRGGAIHPGEPLPTSAPGRSTALPDRDRTPRSSRAAAHRRPPTKPRPPVPTRLHPRRPDRAHPPRPAASPSSPTVDAPGSPGYRTAQTTAGLSDLAAQDRAANSANSGDMIRNSAGTPGIPVGKMCNFARVPYHVPEIPAMPNWNSVSRPQNSLNSRHSAEIPYHVPGIPGIPGIPYHVAEMGKIRISYRVPGIPGIPQTNCPLAGKSKIPRPVWPGRRYREPPPARDTARPVPPDHAPPRGEFPDRDTRSPGSSTRRTTRADGSPRAWARPGGRPASPRLSAFPVAVLRS